MSPRLQAGRFVPMLALAMVAALMVLVPACRAESVQLPPGVTAVWDMAKAYHETTPTRERICINGLWRWQPAGDLSDLVPADNWGYFKVPGPWPGVQDWLQKDCQTAYVNPTWRDQKLGEVTAAWYQREIAIPAGWAGRRISVSADCLNSYAVVFVDGRKAGDMRFPAGDVDLTAICRPGATHLLSVLVVAMPLKGAMLYYSDTAAAAKGRGWIERRGLCGDVYLENTSDGPRLDGVGVETSVRNWQITFRAAALGLAAGSRYGLAARITANGRDVATFASKPFAAADLQDGAFAFTEPWHPDKLWDTDTPGNMYQLTLSLTDAAGKVLDAAAPWRFGFREFWIEGRDFLLNGSRIHLCAVPFDNCAIGAATATYEAVKESLLRLKSFGVNFVYAHNYGCEPGSHVSFEEALRAADDVGMLVALAQPHFSQYDWDAPQADRDNGYARHAEYYVRVARNHPSVVAYSMSHNATGYVEDMNPDMIDGISDARESWGKAGAERALRAQAIVKRLDPTRIVYHHSSGNLGAMHTNNFYPNFAPIQEMDDWFEHWATVGVKPLFLCEFGAPMSWDFAMYRGWWGTAREWGSAEVPWELCTAEWNSQFFGDSAYKIGEVEKADLRWEGAQFRAGNLWHRWDYPYQIGSQTFDDQAPAIATYITDNWRALRSWGVSAINSWEYEAFWKLRPGVDKSRRDLKVDWQNLQRPGFSPDYLGERFERIDTAFQPSDWLPTPAAAALTRNNMPLLAYIGGKVAGFTSKDHVFRPGETVEKQLIVINDTRRPVTCDCRWSVGLPQALSGSQKVDVAAGQQARIPLRMKLPTDLPPGRYDLRAVFAFSTGETQSDSFSLDILPAPQGVPAGPKIAILDPVGETTSLLRGMGVEGQAVAADADLSAYDILVIGKGALKPDGPGPDLARVSEGLKAIVFEQTSEALEKRLGFRCTEYGLRRVFERVPDHPALSGLTPEALHDWRGEATILPPRLKYELSDTYRSTTPTVKWAGLEVPRIWRCGCRGNVSSVLLEKPARGDFLPLLDGGYGLQYSPLMEYREGKGMVLFCQMDVTGRTEGDPAADALTRNLLRYAAAWKPAPSRTALYVGDAAGKRHLEHAGIQAGAYDGGGLKPDQVLVVGSGGGAGLAGSSAAIAEFLKSGGRLLALGLSEQDAAAFLPFKVAMTQAEHIACYFDPLAAGSPLAGVGPADVHNRDPRQIPLVASGATVVGDGVLATAADGRVVFYQLPPYEVTAADGAVPSFTVTGDDAVDGKQSALITMGAASEAGGQFGQAVKVPPEVGKTYTFAAFVKGVGVPVTVHLEVERAGSPWDRAVKGEPVQVSADRWTELHVTFKCEKPFPEGWQAYIGCAQEGGRYRADMMRLYAGDYVPWRAAGAEAEVLPQDLFANPSFEAGTEPWWFMQHERLNVRRTYRRASFTLSRLLANTGVQGATPLLARFGKPVAEGERRWLDGLYLDEPETWDDPYRFFCW